MKKNIKLNFLIITGLFLASGLFILTTTVANANHSWGKYHWDLSTLDTTDNPLKLGTNLSSIWNDSLVQSSVDWNMSVLKNQIVAGTSNDDCNPTSGQIEICNDEYGENGWLGIASIWATKGKNNHITQGVVKLNDTYFNMPAYATQAWRDFVMCQEIGHTFGLDHQDEGFDNDNLGTCMDYTNDPDGSIYDQADNRYPNDHDYDMLTEMYAHLNVVNDGGNGNGKGGGKGKPLNVGTQVNLDNPSEWGQAVRQDASGNDSLFVKEFNNGQILITHVLWAKDF